MRVVHLCRAGWPQVGGMERVVHGLARFQASRGHDVRVVTLDRSVTGGARWQDAVHEGVPYVRVRAAGPRRYPIGLGLGPALSGADVVHVHGVDGLADQLVRGAAPPGARLGLSTHGGYFHSERQAALKQLWLRTVTRSTLSRLDGLWFTSEADAQRFAPAGVPGVVVPDGLALGELLALEPAPEAGRWVCFGRVAGHKGVDRLLAAMPALGERVRVLTVLGSGEAPVLAGLRAQAERLGLGGRVRFVNPRDQDEVHAELVRAELAVFPSRGEGFGLALVEAMAAGCRVLVSGIPAFRERVVHGVSGRIVDFDAPAALAAEAELALGQALGPAAREAARVWDWSVVGLRWDRALAELWAGP